MMHWARKLGRSARSTLAWLEMRTFDAAYFAFLFAIGCAPSHAAHVSSATLAPPPVDMVHHSGRLWIALDEYTKDRQCIAADGKRPVCFVGVHAALERALTATLWPGFSQVRVKGKGDEIQGGDYLLLVSAVLEAEGPAKAGPGWGTRGLMSFRLVRGGIPILSEQAESRSRSDLPYGAELGASAGEVLDALSVHLATRVGTLPEDTPVPGVPLPAVVVTERRSLQLPLSRRVADAQQSPSER